MKVINLIGTYRVDLFQFGISIEYRDEDNYFIQESKYKSYDNFIEYDSFKNKTIIDWFISDDKKIVIRVGDIE